MRETGYIEKIRIKHLQVAHGDSVCSCTVSHSGHNHVTIDLVFICKTVVDEPSQILSSHSFCHSMKTKKSLSNYPAIQKAHNYRNGLPQTCHSIENDTNRSLVNNCLQPFLLLLLQYKKDELTHMGASAQAKVVFFQVRTACHQSFVAECLLWGSSRWALCSSGNVSPTGLSSLSRCANDTMTLICLQDSFDLSFLLSMCFLVLTWATTELFFSESHCLHAPQNNLKSRLSKYSPGCSPMRTALLRFFKYLSEPVRACGFSELFDATDLFLAIAAGWGNSSCSLISSTECSESELSAMTVVSSSDDDKSRPRYLTNPSDSAITAQRLRTAKQSSLWQKLSLSNKNFTAEWWRSHVCMYASLRYYATASPALALNYCTLPGQVLMQMHFLHISCPEPSYHCSLENLQITMPAKACGST